MQEKKLDTFVPKSRKEWRKWLEKNHVSAPSIWLIYYKKNSGVSSLSYSDAVEEALCFGWIDSVKSPIDEHCFMQFFSKRKPKSVWSKVNKAKVERLIGEGQMTKAGLAIIDVAKENGSWDILNDVEELMIPNDLTAALKMHEHAEAFFLGLSNSARKAILQWLVMAKRPETRENRIQEIASLAAQKLKPKQFR